MHNYLKDLLSGVRALRRMPGSALISVVVLGLGIGLCSFMFSIIYGVFFRGIDVPDAHRVFVVHSTRPADEEFSAPVQLRDFVVWRERQTSFSGLLGVSGGELTLADVGGAWRFEAARVTANAFDVLGVAPLLGRGFAAGEDTPGSAPNVLLSHRVWREQFGMDEGVVGRAVRVNGEPAQILGVMPPNFEFPFNNEAWIPLTDDPLAGDQGPGRSPPSVMVFGRLAAGVSRGEAELEMAAIAEQLARERPENQGTGARLERPERAATGGPLLTVFSALMIAVFCVLLVACANVANLLLARAATRTKEAAVRAALGGGRTRVMTPFLAEALALSVAGALLGILIAQVAVGWFDGVTDPARTGRPYFIRFTIDWPVLAFVAAVTGFTALAAGLIPAWKVSRTDVSSVLKDESRGATGLQIGRITKVLVTAEVALSCALLIASGLMTRSITNLGNLDLPFQEEGLLTARLQPPPGSYSDRAARERLWEDLLRELQSLPGVSSAALSTRLPMSGGGGQRIAIEGVVYANEEALPEAGSATVSTGFFETLGAPILAGRDFTVQDARGTPLVAIVNQSMVDRYFDGNALGQQFRRGFSDTLPRLTVVGVVPDLDLAPPGNEDFEPAMYWIPLRQSDAGSLSITARPRTGDPLALTADVRAAVSRVDPEMPIFDVWTETELIARRTWFIGVFGTVFIVFGLAALFMASVGLYGVLAFSVSRRTQEMGIRMALGASTADVIRLVLRQGASQLGIGLALGLALAFGVTRLIRVVMYNVDPQDPLVFGGVLALIVLVGLAAAYFPARRATGVDPVVALRCQ
jgi:predicted permease